jgi:cytochrome c553
MTDLPPLRKLFLWGIGIILAIGVGALAFAWSGLYSVAASSGHYDMTAWFLELGMRSSVQTQSIGVPEAPDLSDEDRVKLGASTYQGNCAICHGAPGIPPSPIVQHMVPAPPLLTNKISQGDDDELFWIVKHGIKYAGMPAWIAQERDDEIWFVTAFLRRLPQLDKADYERLAQGRAEENDFDAATIADSGTGITAVAVCARCHGDENAAPQSSFTPKLAGQSRAYLELALRSYKSDDRKSGIMQPVAWALEEEDINKLAQYYAEMPLQIHTADNPRDDERMDRGTRIATQGLPEKNVPACATCHAGTAREDYPILIGQHPDYIAQQLELWQRGGRGNTPAGRIMQPIAERLDAQDIRDVAAYFGSLGARQQNSASTER